MTLARWRMVACWLGVWCCVTNKSNHVDQVCCFFVPCNEDFFVECGGLLTKSVFSLAGDSRLIAWLF